MVNELLEICECFLHLGMNNFTSVEKPKEVYPYSQEVHVRCCKYLPRIMKMKFEAML